MKNDSLKFKMYYSMISSNRNTKIFIFDILILNLL